jgi:hypothetical protein
VPVAVIGIYELRNCSTETVLGAIHSMLDELEQRYAALKGKVHELREYL